MGIEREHLGQKIFDEVQTRRNFAKEEERIRLLLSDNRICLFTFHTGGCLLSREKAVKDVNSRVGFCFLVGVMLNFDWSIFFLANPNRE